MIFRLAKASWWRNKVLHLLIRGEGENSEPREEFYAHYLPQLGACICPPADERMECVLKGFFGDEVKVLRNWITIDHANSNIHGEMTLVRLALFYVSYYLHGTVP